MSKHAARPEPSIYDVHADLGVPASEPVVLALLGDLLKHLQYSRGQCYQLVDRVQSLYKARTG